MNDEVKLMYCTTCKKKTETNEKIGTYSKNGKFMLSGKCAICNKKKQEFANKEEETRFKTSN